MCAASRTLHSGSWSLRRWGRACIHRICPTLWYFRELTYLFLELEWSWPNFVVTSLKIFKPNDSTKKLSQMVLSQVTGNPLIFDPVPSTYFRPPVADHGCVSSPPPPQHDDTHGTWLMTKIHDVIEWKEKNYRKWWYIVDTFYTSILFIVSDLNWLELFQILDSSRFWTLFHFSDLFLNFQTFFIFPVELFLQMFIIQTLFPVLVLLIPNLNTMDIRRYTRNTSRVFLERYSRPYFFGRYSLLKIHSDNALIVTFSCWPFQPHSHCSCRNPCYTLPLCRRPNQIDVEINGHLAYSRLA